MTCYEKALNMCGYNSPNDFIKTSLWKGYYRIYIGHEYCSAFLISFEKQLKQILSIFTDDINITLVLPVMQEIHWGCIENICSIIATDPRVNELVVNDFGTLLYCAEKLSTKKIILGKLFNKLSREVRINLWDYKEIKKKELLSENIYETNSFKLLMQKYNINRVETELISKEYLKIILNQDFDYYVDIHYPFVYITSGTICPLNSTLASERIQFKNKMSCPCKCKDTLIIINNPILDRYLINRGNTYMYRTDCNADVFNEIYKSAKQYRLVVNEHYGELKK